MLPILNVTFYRIKFSLIKFGTLIVSSWDKDKSQEDVVPDLWMFDANVWIFDGQVWSATNWATGSVCCSVEAWKLKSCSTFHTNVLQTAGPISGVRFRSLHISIRCLSFKNIFTKKSFLCSFLTSIIIIC